MPRVLVTGGAGFIGSHTVDHLLASGYEVRILDNLEPRVHPLGAPGYLPSEAEFLIGDVADRSTMERALDGVDYVMHLAAYQDYLPDFSTFIHVNAESSALIFEVIVERRLPIRNWFSLRRNLSPARAPTTVRNTATAHPIRGLSHSSSGEIGRSTAQLAVVICRPGP